MESSEGEEARKKEAEKAAKKKKGLSEAELNAIIDVNLKETSTITFMCIKQVVVN